MEINNESRPGSTDGNPGETSLKFQPQHDSSDDKFANARSEFVLLLPSKLRRLATFAVVLGLMALLGVLAPGNHDVVLCWLIFPILAFMTGSFALWSP